MYDVIIIGSGIVGSFTANELAILGYRVCVLEKNTQAGNKTSCTGIISRECMDLLSVDLEVIQQEARSAKIYSPSGNYIRIERETPQAYVLDRPALDRVIVMRAQEKGVEFHFSTCASNIKNDNKYVHVQAQHEDELSNFKARAVVIAGGFGTALPRACGLGQINYYAQGAQAQVIYANIDEAEVYADTDIAPGFFAWLVPISKFHAKAGLLCRGNPQQYMRRFLDRLEQQGKIRKSEYDISYDAVPLKPSTRTYADRLIAVGDAAGQVKPTTGGGIYFGLLCARIATQTLHEALKADDLSAKRLYLYQKRWHKILHNELAVDYWAHRFYRKLDNRQIEHIFNIIERHGIHESLLTSPDITFDWHSKIIMDAIKHRSLQRSLEKLKI